jgi:mono/diheme cytochrome c family protein
MMTRNSVKILPTAAIALGVAALLLPALAQDALPAGPGMEETLKGCGGCHGITQFLTEKRLAEEWANTVTMMITLGAPVSNDDFDKVVTYLATYFGPNPSPASPQESSTPAPAPQ